MWLITNKPFPSHEKKNSSSFFTFSTNQVFYQDSNSGIIILVEGYILPRIGISNDLSIPEFILYTYLEHGKDFIHKVKGNFIILIIDNSNFSLFSDRFAIKKFFTWQSGQDIILSNDIGMIRSLTNSKPSKENIAIYALTYHFIGGSTLFDDIYHNSPAEYIIFSEGSLERNVYWDAQQLATLEEKHITPEEIASLLQRIMDSYLDYSITNKFSLSLTAGVDSRLLFSLLKSKQIDLHTYTYGNPASIDAVIAKIIAERYRVPHEIHSIEFSFENIDNLTKETVANGQSLCSLHRAHRYMAIGLEAAYGESMFLGTMGGEFIKSTNHDDYIISDFVYEFSQNHDIITIDKYLLQKFIRSGSVNTEKLLDFFRSQEWCKNPEFVDLYGLVEIAASLHHGQNDKLYSRYFKQLFTPYIDIDYLEALFSSSYHFLFKKEHLCKLKQRLDNHRFGAEIQKISEPGLLQVPYNSGIIAAEYLKSPLLAAIKARIRKKRWDFPPNFPLGKFMEDYVEEYLMEIKRNPGIINEVFDIEGLLKELKTKRNHHSTEAYWLKYTTPIQMHLIMDCFA